MNAESEVWRFEVLEAEYAAGVTKLILDVDTGTDDAIAIMLAALDPRLELVAVTTVAGNTSIEHTTENTLRVLDHIGREAPVYRGAAGALLPSTAVAADRERSGKIHGDYLDLPPATRRRSNSQRREFLVDAFDDGSDDRARPDGAADERCDRPPARSWPRRADPAARADGRKPRPRRTSRRRPSSTSGPTPRPRGSCCAAASAT